MFEKHIDITAKVTTDKWKGYNPIAKDYDLTQILSDKGSNFKALQVMIHQVKSWIRTTYSWVSEKISIAILMSFATELIVLKAKTRYSII